LIDGGKINPVIDADGHVFEIDESWENYADPTYGDRWSRLVTDTKGRQIYLFEGRYSHTGPGSGSNPRKRDSKLPDVPTIFELIEREKTPAATRSLVNVILDAGGFGSYPIVSSVRVPSEREFLEEAKNNRWELKTVPGEELEVLAKELIVQPPEVIERMK
jgi:hypothetical protein